MNNKYVRINETAVVTDEKGEITTRDYTDNIDEILATENLIESINYRVAELESDIEWDIITLDLDKKSYIFSVFLVAGISIGLSIAVSNAISPEWYIEIMRFIKIPVRSLVTAAGNIVTIVIASINYLKLRFDNMVKFKNIKGNNNAMNYLMKQKEKNIDHLKNLHNDKTVKASIGDEASEVVLLDSKNYDIKFDELKKEEIMHYSVGYNADLFAKWDAKGKLSDKLENRGYDEDYIELAFDYLDSSDEYRQTRGQRTRF